MASKSTKLITLFIFLIISGIFYYNSTGNVIKETQTAVITRIIDGDTVDSSLGEIRLLGINTPEKKNSGYQEAKNFLSNLTLNKTVELETQGNDKYGRTLAYIILNNELINKKLLQEGLATLYYYEKDNYYKEMKKAEELAREQEKGLWKKSSNSSCIQLIRLIYTENGERCTNQEQLILNNSCNQMQINLKDDANHIENINLEQGIYTQNFSCVFNDEGDSLYIRDNSGLILFYRY